MLFLKVYRKLICFAPEIVLDNKDSMKCRSIISKDYNNIFIIHTHETEVHSNTSFGLLILKKITLFPREELRFKRAT